MASSVTLLLRDHPELQPLILHDVTPTGNTIGAGAYGSVEEVEIPGAICAAKKLHHFLTTKEKDWVTKDMVDKNVGKFVAECKMMARLRHPNIVQFLGLWFSQDEDSCVPAIVMEKMQMSLHKLLDPKPSVSPKEDIPLGLKCSILQDIARGIAYLHKQKPPVIHRDLTAANVLLNSFMVAKIADLGVARILPEKANATMTEIPGTMVYMPPEAMEERAKYNTSIDLFSLGVVALFVLSQEFPRNLKAPNYTCDEKGLVARTELERREKYTAKIHGIVPTPLMQLIESCLKNNPRARPSIDEVLKLLGQAIAECEDRTTEPFHQRGDRRARTMLESTQHKCDAGPQQKVRPRSTSEPPEMEAAPINQSQGPLESSKVKKSKRWKFWSNKGKKIKNVTPGEKVETLSPITDEEDQLHQEGASLGMQEEETEHSTMTEIQPTNAEVDQDSDGSSTGENTQANKSPRIRSNYVNVVPLHTGSGSREQVVTEKEEPQSPSPHLPESSRETKPHEKMETWFMKVDRDRAIELLKDSVNGTFLCRPTAQQTELESGEVHTHTIDVMCEGVQHHVRVYHHDGKYGVTTPCTFSSLMELVLHYSENCLSYHNSDLQTTLKFPLKC